MFTIDDIQVFVATHNRADLLRQTLHNLLKQTAGLKEITVLDNESTDNTEQIVSGLAKHGIQYVRTKGFLGNFKKAQALATKPYCMLFHDDDLLHPSYLQNVLQALNTYSNVSLVTCAHDSFQHSDIPSFPSKVPSAHILFNSSEQWAKFIYFYEGISYAPAVYRTDAFRSAQLEYEKFHKFNDWPFMAKMAQYGNLVYFIDKHFMYMRNHPGQDSANTCSFPSIKQIINWDKFFFNMMGSPGPTKVLYWIYGFHNKHFLLGKYHAAPADMRKKYPFKCFKQAVKKAGLPVWNFRSLFPVKWIILPLQAKLERKILSKVRTGWVQ